MSSPTNDHAARLRAAFDASFGLPAGARPAPPEAILGISVGDANYALRLCEIALLAPHKVVTPVPGGPPWLLGIASLRGALIPVYDLSGLLGHGARGSTAWMAVAGAARVALAFEHFLGHFVPGQDFITWQTHGGHVQGLARIHEQNWPILNLPSLVTTIQAQVNRSGA